MKFFVTRDDLERNHYCLLYRMLVPIRIEYREVFYKQSTVLGHQVKQHRPQTMLIMGVTFAALHKPLDTLLIRFGLN